MIKFISKTLFVTAIFMFASSTVLIPVAADAADWGSSNTSSSGSWGSNSSSGSWGSSGSSGSWGSTGSTGSWGSTGSTGSWGSSDSSGSWGSSGSSGSWGSTGSTGSWGSTGSTGSWGSTGSSGSWGSSLSSGNTGTTYTTGNTGTYTVGNTGTYTTGNTGSYTVGNTGSYQDYSDYDYTNVSYGSTPSYYASSSYYPSSSYYSSTPQYYSSSYSYTPPTYTPPVYQPYCVIYANPTYVPYNGSTTLTWNSQYATSASLSDVGSVAVNGSYTLHNITSNRTFTLTVSGQGGTATCVTYVTVQPQQTPFCTINANPNQVAYNGSSTITWSSTNATSASLSGVGSVAVNGSYTVHNITSNRTFTLTVYGANGQQQTCTTYVNTTQQQAPYCTLTINPSVLYGYNWNYNNQSNQSATLSWTTTNATSAHISDVGSVNTGSGSRVVYPGYTRTYTMTVYGANGQTNTCSAPVTVQNQQQGNLFCSIYANPTTIEKGKYSTLTWTSTGAVSAMISDGIGNVNTNGSLNVYPDTTRTYTLTVRDAQGYTQTCNTTVNVSGSYISLTQIPYTGFDFGVIGNTLYWAVLAGGAAAAAYLLTMYRGGILGFAFANAKEAAIRKAEIVEEAEDEEEPIADAETDTVETENIGDAMTLETVNGMPRLVINRNRGTGTEGLPGTN